ncbi:MAG: iron chelate uptake ABC transporter family permease subunit, partial [Deltaproteobacteria bacterium]|nr:iron chelate uptake ABC transporter family permease subunit [Deltaproteobacteria bacterium]
MRRTNLALACLLICMLCPLLGITDISWQVALNPWGAGALNTGEYQIFWSIRVPRVCLAALSGAALAVGGMVFQGIFRNYLACPFTLGVSTGAAFGAALYFWLGLGFAVAGISGSSLFAFAGALGTIGTVYFLSSGLSSSAMLLAGVVVSFFFSSLIVFLQYISDFQGMFKIMRWLMGGFETVGWGAVISVLPFVLLGLVLVRLFERDLDLLTLGDDLALSRGANVNTARLTLFFATSL